MGKFEDAYNEATKALDDHTRKNLSGAMQWTRDHLISTQKNFAGARVPAMQYLEFCKNCKVKISKPRTIRSVKRSHNSAKGRTIKPQVVLSYNGKSVKPECSFHMKDGQVILGEFDDTSVLYTGGGQVPTRKFPRVAYMFDSVLVGLGNLPVELNTYTTHMVLAFNEDAGEHWQEVIDTIRTHIRDIGNRADEIVSEHFAKKGPKERQIFQEKFSNVLTNTTDLIDAPPDAILAIFKLGWSEIEALMRFARRNESDIELVELEDIVEAQRNAQVKKVMTE